MTISDILSIIAIVVAVMTFLIYLFQTYYEVFTLYYFAKVDIVLIPNGEVKDIQAFIEDSSMILRYDVSLCDFDHAWVGDFRQLYFTTTMSVAKLKSIPMTKLMHKHGAYSMFRKIFVTKQGKRNYRKWYRQNEKQNKVNKKNNQ